MITTINEWKKIYEFGNNLNHIYDDLSEILMKHNIVLKDETLVINNEKIGEIRISTYEDYLVMEMIYLNDNKQKMGYGTIIYTSLLDVALKNNYEGIFSPAFDISSGQQRSTKATNLMQKLVKQLGGFIEPADDVDEDELIEEFEEDGIPFFGPPYLDIYLTGDNINESINENMLQSTLINIEKLEQYANGIAIVCGGEYGVTYFKPDQNKIWIMVGDANPFDESYLIDFLKGFVAVDFKMDILDQIHVEVEPEAMPGTDETGWYKWTGKKWESYDDNND